MSEKSIGALWSKSSPKGQYMTGNIEINGEKVAIVCFLNINKKEAKHPDWNILKSVPKENEQPLNALPEKENEIKSEDVPW